MNGNMEKEVNLAKGKVFQIKKGHKYLVIMNAGDMDSSVGAAMQKLFSEAKVLVIAAKNPDEVRIAEYMEE